MRFSTLVSGLGLAYLTTCAFAAHAQQAPAASTRTVWDGIFTDAQAERGKREFSNHCAECHGDNLEGGEGKALTGTQFWQDWTQTTVGELVTFVKTNMPMSEDGSLKGTLPTGTYVDIVTHILKSNGFPAGSSEMTVDSSVGVQIIPKDGPGELPANARAVVVGCLARANDGTWHVEKGTRPRRAGAVGTLPDRDTPLGTRDYELKFVLTSLQRMVGHRVAVTGVLLGGGGINGINVSTVTSVSDTCN